MKVAPRFLTLKDIKHKAGTKLRGVSATPLRKLLFYTRCA